MCEVGIPAKAGTQSHHPSFPRRRESNPIIRHSREGGNPTPSSVIPAKAGIQPHHPSFPRRREPNLIIRHSREGGNPTSSSVIPAKAGTQSSSSVIPAKAGTQSHHPSFPRRRESNPIIRHSREGGNPTPSSVIPAKAGIHNSGIHRPLTPMPEKKYSGIPAKAGMTLR